METVDKGIHINRGDRITIRIKSKKENFKVGDKLKFSIVDKDNYNNVFFQKVYEVTEESEYALIPLMEEDTRFVTIDKKPFKCKYEIEYNGAITLVGSSDDEDNLMIIYAEAGDKGWK